MASPYHYHSVGNYGEYRLRLAIVLNDDVTVVKLSTQYVNMNAEYTRYYDVGRMVWLPYATPALSWWITKMKTFMNACYVSEDRVSGLAGFMVVDEGVVFIWC